MYLIVNASNDAKFLAKNKTTGIHEWSEYAKETDDISYITFDTTLEAQQYGQSLCRSGNDCLITTPWSIRSYDEWDRRHYFRVYYPDMQYVV